MIKGTAPFLLDKTNKSHVARAFWLTAKVETGARYGTVMAYDGTGMTAGLDQHIAVFPKELANEDYNAKDDQGSLWELLRRMEVVDGTEGYKEALRYLWSMFESKGWYVSQDGRLRYLHHTPVRRRHYTHDAKPGELVFGFEIRDALTPSGGRVHEGDKPLAEWWARAFHELFSHPDGFMAQRHFGEEHLVNRSKRKRRWVQGWRSSVEDLMYPGDITALHVGSNGWSEEADLAMCMYQSNSVNAPGMANRLLGEVASRVDPKTHQLLFAIRLIQKLGSNSYGRWDDDLKTGRYQRTRSAARASGLWPRRLFDGARAIMPIGLPG
jgi:hypothetical protein